ncbi:hypothetical protein L6164_022111 [Bauhinia variegata]|uniref:Uncharacterized protein n=1 Tax=Bauhinia variegata TaxID=167791 RepID=A0ACB9MFH9_BAUVA|nr:hypothetical protein L6164_022111 [Bauhinia variegata]
MDEFLANILNSDESQVISDQSTQDEATAAQKESTAAATEPTPNPQQASFSVPPPICNKTVDEVWSEIHKGQPQQNEANGNNLTQSGTLRKQPTPGLISLEDFLVKAGVVQKSALPLSSPSQPTSLPNQTNIIRPLQPSYGLGAAIAVGFSTQQNVGDYVPTMAYPRYQMFPQNNSIIVNGPKTSWVTPDRFQNMREPSGVNTKRRIIDGSPEVAVERRQRRMLKNRESAARSRARRQAYTVELEAELTQLKQENDMLKQVLAEAERKREEEITLKKNPMKAEKRAKQLRAISRTVSAPW